LIDAAPGLSPLGVASVWLPAWRWWRAYSIRGRTRGYSPNRGLTRARKAA